MCPTEKRELQCPPLLTCVAPVQLDHVLAPSHLQFLHTADAPILSRIRHRGPKTENQCYKLETLFNYLRSHT